MTKLVKNGIPTPFITDNDIIITNLNHSGQTLDKVFDDVDETLDRHQEEINKLKSNLKYVYSYGGVGGKGSGSSDSSDSAAILFVSLDGKQLHVDSSNSIILDGPGRYVLKASVSNSGGKKFWIKMDTAENINNIKLQEISIEANQCTYTKELNLIKNGTVVVEFYDSDIIQLSRIEQGYIINPHTFDAKFMYKFDNGSGKVIDVEFNPYEYFIGNTIQKDPFIDISFKIDVPNVTNVSVEYSIGDTDEIKDEESEYISGQGIKQYGETTDISNNSFQIPLGKLRREGRSFIDEYNTGTYTINVTLKYSIGGVEKSFDKTPFTITLIPNYLYMRVRNPQNLIYDYEDLIDAINHGPHSIPDNTLNIGTYASFFCKIFEKQITGDKKSYSIELKGYDRISDTDPDVYEFDEENPAYISTPVTIKEQTEMVNPISAVFRTPGVKKLVFTTYGQKSPSIGVKYDVVKYIYVVETTSDINWYPSDLVQNNYYFRANTTEPYSENFPQILGNTPFEMRENDKPITLSDSAWNTSSGYKTTILSLGIQYNSINKDGAKIISTFSPDYNNENFILYSDTFFSKKICIPTENQYNKFDAEKYHLIQIVKHRIGIVGETEKFATYLYVDGKLESNKSQADDDNSWFIGRIVLNNVNVSYNLINLQYVNLPLPITFKDNYEHIQTGYSIDEIIYQYYLAYKKIMGAGIVSKAEQTIFSNMSSIKFDGENTVVPFSFVETISGQMPIPTMVMEYLNDDEIQLTKFRNLLFKGYKDGDTESFPTTQLTNLYWCKGFKENETHTLEKVSIPEITDPDTLFKYTGNWFVKLQGTSTMKNKIKNFSLLLTTEDQANRDKSLVVSPNYDRNDTSTFLPEKEWTLKADIADSAHANNTSIGKFVNTNCTKFSESNAVGFSNNIKPYIKNTLEGFPFMMYFKIGGETYYLGVYNFNLGRGSYYNLGYNTPSDTENMISMIEDDEHSVLSPFKFSIGTCESIKGLSIGEIQDNNSEFDFHIYDPSVLFGSESAPGVSTMFGPDSKITGNGTNVDDAKQTLQRFVESVALAGAYCFSNIGKTPITSRSGGTDLNVGSDAPIKRYDIKSYIDPATGITRYIEYVPDTKYQFGYDRSTGQILWNENGINFNDIKDNINNLYQCISDTNLEGERPSNYHTLNFTSASEYYTICMAFGLVDSILKNLNIKSWNNKTCYIAFYDMDCALGEDNMGTESVSYLAATDYWHSDIKNGYLQPVTLNTDYWNPEVGKGFDFTSSYLFAIAKYAQVILGNMKNYPQQFWAKLRQPNGELRNANYFVEKYFSSGIGKIPSYMASLNYQVKYLYYGEYTDEITGEIKTDYLANQGAFNGTRIEKVKDWLKKRLHFLDLTFNVQNIEFEIGTSGFKLPKIDQGLQTGLTDNDDVVLLWDAFTKPTAGNALKTWDVSVVVKAPKNTPFIMSNGKDNKVYILGAETGEPNYLKINTSETVASRFLGSKEFTYINKIEPFITSGNIINTNNLEEVLYGKEQFTTVHDGEFDIISTSIKRVELCIPNLGGLLKIDNTSSNGQSLQSLDVSGSSYYGDWSGLKNLYELKIASVNSPRGTISSSNCQLIGDKCIISGTDEKPTTLTKLELSNVSGNFNISHTNITEINLSVESGKEGTVVISGDIKLSKVTLTGFKSIEINNCPNLSVLSIIETESNKCEVIKIDIPEYGEEHNLLHGLNGQSDDVFDFTRFESLELLRLCGTEAVVVKIPDKIVSIESFSRNQKLEFIDTSGKDSCIRLTQDSTFYNCPRYGMRQSWWSKNDTPAGGESISKTMDGDESKYCNKANPGLGNFTRMCISDSCTSLANTFNKVNGSESTIYATNPYKNFWGQWVINKVVDMSAVTWFLNEAVSGVLDCAWIENKSEYNEETGEYDIDYYVHDRNNSIEGETKEFGNNCKSHIESLQSCFNLQKGISYNGSTHISKMPHLSEYKKLTNISSMFLGTNISCLSADLLSLPQELNNIQDLYDDSIPNRTLYWSEFIGNGEVKILPDAFKNISYRITSLSNLQLNVKDPSSSNALKDIVTSKENRLDIMSLLWPKRKGYDTQDAQEYDEEVNDYIPFERLTYIEAFNISTAHWVDYSKLLDFCPNVTHLRNFLKCDLSKAKIDNILQNCTHLVEVTDSFTHTGNMNDLKDEDAINLYTFFNWNNLSSIRELFSTRGSTGFLEPGFAVKKYLNNEDFKSILNILPTYTEITKLSNLFSYCTIKNYDSTEIILGDGTVDMNKITNVNSLFYQCKTDDGTPLKIRRSFFNNLKNVTTVTNTFGGVYFDHMLPYDFFCKRTYTSIDNNIYVLTDSGYKPATLHTISYGSYLISNMYNCFKDAKFKNCKCWFDPFDENDEENFDKNGNSLKPKKDYVEYNGDSSYTSYYRLDKGNYVEYPITEPDAYIDTLNNFTNYVSTVKSDIQERILIKNHDIDGDMNTYGNRKVGYPYDSSLMKTFNIAPTYCCIPPDIFHTCTDDCDLTCVFADTNIIGVIPQHLVKKCYNGKFNNMFRNVNILPNLVYHYNSNTVNQDFVNLITNAENKPYINIPVDNTTITIKGPDEPTYTLDDSGDAVVLFRNSNGELRRRYPIVGGEYNKSQFSYVPQGYTTNANLTEAFTFRYNLPQQVDLVRSFIPNWPTGTYFDDTCSPDNKPEIWPYYTQYFFTVDESIDWRMLNSMKYPFISDYQDIDFEFGKERVFSTTLENSAPNRWWNERRTEDNEKNMWKITEGVFNVFLDLCGERDVRTGKYIDCGCKVSKSINLTKYPKLDSFVSGILTVFLNGKVFDNIDAGVLSAPLYADSKIIRYYGFGRNIIFPSIITVPSDISKASTVLLEHVENYSLFYVYMFPSDSLNYYMSIFKIEGNRNMEITNMSNIPESKSNRYKITESS